jgi:hypothetical protein
MEVDPDPQPSTLLFYFIFRFIQNFSSAQA